MITGYFYRGFRALLPAAILVSFLSGCSIISDKTASDSEGTESMSSSIDSLEEKLIFLYVDAADNADISPHIEVVNKETGTVLNLDEYTYSVGYVAKIDNGIWTVTADYEGCLTKTATVTVSDENSIYHVRFSLEKGSEESEDDSDESDGTDEPETASSEFAVHEDSVPPDDALEYNGHYYKVYGGIDKNHPVTWDEAKEQCEKVGGHLATIETEEEQEFLKGNLYLDGHDYWLGGFYDEDAGTWKWITGEEIIYSAWNNEPSEDDSHENPYMGVSDSSWQFYNESARWYYSGIHYKYIDGIICEWEPAESG